MVEKRHEVTIIQAAYIETRFHVVTNLNKIMPF